MVENSFVASIPGYTGERSDDFESIMARWDPIEYGMNGVVQLQGRIEELKAWNEKLQTDIKTVMATSHEYKVANKNLGRNLEKE